MKNRIGLFLLLLFAFLVGVVTLGYTHPRTEMFIHPFLQRLYLSVRNEQQDVLSRKEITQVMSYDVDGKLVNIERICLQLTKPTGNIFYMVLENHNGVIMQVKIDFIRATKELCLEKNEFVLIMVK